MKIKGFVDFSADRIIMLRIKRTTRSIYTPSSAFCPLDIKNRIAYDVHFCADAYLKDFSLSETAGATSDTATAFAISKGMNGITHIPSAAASPLSLIAINCSVPKK